MDQSPATDSVAALATIRRSWGPASREAGAQTPRTLADNVFARLRADILGARLAPGRRLRFGELKCAYDTGLTPLREALYQLAADGLVVTEGQKGFRVAPVSLAELREIAALRGELEGMALRASIIRGDAGWKQDIAIARTRLAAAAARLSHHRQRKRRRMEILLHDGIRCLHAALISGCGSPWLLHFCERLQDQTERYRHCYPGTPIQTGFRLAHYEALADVALSGDDKRACDLLAMVIARQAAHVAAAMRRTRSAAAPVEAEPPRR